MKKKSIALTLTAVMLALAVGIGGTIAYFTDTAGKVTNTFTTSKGVIITLDEDKVDPDTWEWKNDGSVRTDEGNTYNKIYPSAELHKDPTIHVSDKSEKAYVAMQIQVTKAEQWKQIAKDYKITDLEKIFGGYVEANWQKIRADEDKLTFVFMWEKTDADGNNKGIVNPGESCMLFNTVTIPAELTNDEIASLEGFEIIATAYAVQANGLEYETAKTELLKLVDNTEF